MFLVLPITAFGLDPFELSAVIGAMVWLAYMVKSWFGADPMLDVVCGFVFGFLVFLLWPLVAVLLAIGLVLGLYFVVKYLRWQLQPSSDPADAAK